MLLKLVLTVGLMFKYSNFSLYSDVSSNLRIPYSVLIESAVAIYVGMAQRWRRSIRNVLALGAEIAGRPSNASKSGQRECESVC